jgi:hypothetical protein
MPNICGCTPKTCGSQKCGTINPGCGLPAVSCGQCSGTDVCNAGVCCTPNTCGSKKCGSIDRGCGLGPVSCGQCPGDDAVCVSGSCCTPRTCGALGCGRLDPGCGRAPVFCGACPSGMSCQHGICESRECPCGGQPGACQFCEGLTGETAESPFCAAKSKNCGWIDDGGGGQVNCGTCKGNDTCGGGGVPNVCGRPPVR